MLDWVNSLLDGSLFEGGVFLVIGIVGALLLIISVMLDGIFDVFDFGDGPLSLTTIAAFTAIFGFAAFAMVGAGASAGVAGVVGAVAGVAGGGAAWWLSRLIRSAESNTAVRSDELVGAEANVVLAITQGRLGEVALVKHGERVSLAASASSDIARGTRVRITQVLTSTSVMVEAIVEDEKHANSADPVQPEEPTES